MQYSIDNDWNQYNIQTNITYYNFAQLYILKQHNVNQYIVKYWMIYNSIDHTMIRIKYNSTQYKLSLNLSQYNSNSI